MDGPLSTAFAAGSPAWGLGQQLCTDGSSSTCAFRPVVPFRIAAATRTRACAGSEELAQELPSSQAPRTDQEYIPSSRPPWADPDYTVAPPNIFKPSQVPVADAMEFFRAREGTWSSWRVTHHLAFRRAESGASEIVMKCIDKDDERIVKLLKDNDLPIDAAQGGCYVTWKAVMAWDQEGENHEGSTVFALVADDDDVRRGRIIRDRGYAEIVPIAGTYFLDKENALCLETPYDGGAVEERFVFETIDLLHRVSTVRRFGGLSNATFTTERRTSPRGSDFFKPSAAASKSDEESQVGERSVEEAELFRQWNMEDEADDDGDDSTELTQEELDLVLSGSLFLFGGAGGPATEMGKPGASSSVTSTPMSSTSARVAATRRNAGQSQRPSPGSAFSQGFSGGGSAAQPAKQQPSPAEARAGIDLSKVPPSMRADFERSLRTEDGPQTSKAVPADGTSQTGQ
jgi:CpeS-like protein